jgi:hypothetical protein
MGASTKNYNAKHQAAVQLHRVPKDQARVSFYSMKNNIASAIKEGYEDHMQCIEYHITIT